MSTPALIRAYLALSHVTAPLWALALRRRARQGKEDPDRLQEKWGKPRLPRPDGPLIWLHGVSVGETAVLLTLLERLSAARPDAQFLLTSITRASADALAGRALPPRVIHHYAPVDCPDAVRRFLDHWRPDLFVLSEMDLWPRLLAETRARAIPMLMLNAHVTERRLRRRRRFARANGWLMDLFDEIHVQDDASRRRFVDIGAPAAKMQVTGLLKGASSPPPDRPALRARLAPAITGKPRWLAASTKSPEEPLIMQTHAEARQTAPDLLLIIAPRQKTEANATEAAARVHFAPDQIARRSAGAPLTDRTAVYIADTIGEMGLWLRLVPVAYTGQSLPVPGVTQTGKNPFEAAALGVMILHGPHIGNFQAAYDTLRATGGALEVASGAALAKAVLDAQDPAFRAPFVAAAAAVMARMQRPLDLAEAAVLARLPAPCTASA
ncbi:MAG: 3-deoxy-D-manno-octulosonic acid transferase [Roseinatronobacter sp.]